MYRWLKAYFRWRLARPLIGSPTWHQDMLRWKHRRPRYRRKEVLRFPSAYDWGLAKHRDRQRRLRSSLPWSDPRSHPMQDFIDQTRELEWAYRSRR